MKRRLFSLVMVLALVLSLVPAVAVTAGAEETETKELAVTKTAEWIEKGETAAVTVDIASNYEQPVETQKVLIMATTCNAHGMTAETLTNSLEALHRYADVDYNFYPAEKQGSTEWIYGTLKRTDSDSVKETLYGEIRGAMDSAHHRGGMSMVLDLYDILCVNKKSYDYIVFEFDSALIAGGNFLFYQIATKATAVATVLNNYYNQGKVLWATDADVKTDYDFFHNGPSNRCHEIYSDGSTKDFYLDASQMELLSTLVAPYWFLSNKADSYNKNWLVKLKDVNSYGKGYDHKVNYNNVNDLANMIHREVGNSQYQLKITDTLQTGLTASEAKLQSSADGTTWADVPGVTPTVKDGTITAEITGIGGEKQYRLVYQVTADETFEPGNIETGTQTVGTASVTLTPNAGTAVTETGSAELVIPTKFGFIAPPQPEPKDMYVKYVLNAGSWDALKGKKIRILRSDDATYTDDQTLEGRFGKVNGEELAGNFTFFVKVSDLGDFSLKKGELVD